MKSRLNKSLSLLWSSLLLALMLIGLSGILYKIFRPGGWLAWGWDHLWEVPTLISVVMIVAVLVALKWFDQRHSELIGKFGLYAMAAVGLYFIIKIWISGSP